MPIYGVWGCGTRSIGSGSLLLLAQRVALRWTEEEEDEDEDEDDRDGDADDDDDDEDDE